MVRLIFILLVAGIALVIWASKQIAGHTLGNENLKSQTLKQQTSQTVGTAARGINWLQQEWDKAKASSDTETRETTQSAERPFLGFCIIVDESVPTMHDDVFELLNKIASQFDCHTRIDSNKEAEPQTGAYLLRVCFDTTTMSGSQLDELRSKLIDTANALARAGVAAFGMKEQDGQIRILFKNKCCDI